VSQPTELNLGDLIRRGVRLRTREVLAIVHEVTRLAGAACPRSSDAIAIADSGAVTIAAGDGPGPAIDPRAGVADLLEAN
jgi:hypothetical protein